MSQEPEIEYEWPRTGTLKIRVKGNLQATLRFSPDEEALMEKRKTRPCRSPPKPAGHNKNANQ